MRSKFLVVVLGIALGLVACASPPRGTVAPRPTGADEPRLTPGPAAPRSRSAPAPDVRRAALVVETARSYLGAPYRYGGEDAGGIDCSGLVLRSFERAAIDLPRTARAQASMGFHVARTELAPADLVVFAQEGGGVGHIGIWIGSGRFIHASTSRGVVVEDLRTRWFADRFVGGRRILRH